MKKNLKRALAVLGALGTIGLAAAGGKALHSAGKTQGHKTGYMDGINAAAKQYGHSFETGWTLGAREGFQAGRNSVLPEQMQTSKL